MNAKNFNNDYDVQKRFVQFLLIRSNEQKIMKLSKRWQINHKKYTFNLFLSSSHYIFYVLMFVFS